MSLLPETAELLLFCLKPKVFAMVIIGCHVAVRGKNSNYKVLIWGRLLNKENHTARHKLPIWFRWFVVNIFAMGNLSSGVIAATRTSTVSKCKPLERVLGCRRSLKTGPGCPSWHPPSDSRVTHPQRAGTEAIPASKRALLTLWGPGKKHGQAGKSWHFPGRRQQNFAMPILQSWLHESFCLAGFLFLPFEYLALTLRASLQKYLKRSFPFNTPL